MSKLIIGLVGPLASGKGVVKEYICEKYQAKSYKFSTVFRDILNRLHLPISRENMQNLSLDLRQRFGEDILAEVIAQDAKDDSSEIIVIDGARRLADIKYLKEIPEFKLISIDSDPKLRFQRVMSRNENAGDKDKTYEDFEKEEKRESELEIPKVMSISDYQIDNNKDFKHLYGQVDNILAKITSYEK